MKSLPELKSIYISGFEMNRVPKELFLNKKVKKLTFKELDLITSMVPPNEKMAHIQEVHLISLESACLLDILPVMKGLRTLKLSKCKLQESQGGLECMALNGLRCLSIHNCERSAKEDFVDFFFIKTKMEKLEELKMELKHICWRKETLLGAFPN
jgi:hypothetical protein